ncbi:MAG: hypothetical protein FWB84_03705 [Candidatus Bathyarchaeota archaeon]|uniref:hypothetical protein n=1 Tax=Candidatus Bathycorpusculum sp. TaxID=2994959 RepID=UPI00281D6AF1|nr:hypothetical protein [Candidatus Termiticorpusculum sp.]MCL2292648.1 hypothetical protein [Candidatus Termiticorpusculum sp.]
MLPTLNEYQRKRYLTIEAKTLDHGEITLINQLTKTSHQTLTNGIKEINNPKTQIPKTRQMPQTRSIFILRTNDLF